jgi:hypothetical protein
MARHPEARHLPYSEAVAARQKTVSAWSWITLA